MEILEKLFGSATKAKLMRAFVYNPNIVFEANSLAKKIKSRPDLVKKEINVLEKSGLIKRKQTKNEKGRAVLGAVLNSGFLHLDALRDFLFRVSPLSEGVLVRKLSSAGRVKLIVVSGIFINQEESRVDLLLVSDRPDEKKLKKILIELESEFGRELSYVLLSSDDFTYRLGMGDKLMRDIFDFNHKVVLNKIGLVE
jgi:DNA-binding MarR family transcriptional regulator